MKKVFSSCCLSMGLFGAAFSAHAGTIVSTSGQVSVLATPPSNLTHSGIQSDTSAFVFQENQFTLASPVVVDISQSGLYTTTTSLTPGTVNAGTFANVYLLETNPATVPPAPNDFRTYLGSITFDTPILGLLVETTSLRGTDSSLGAPGTTYPAGSDVFSGVDFNTPGCVGATCGNDQLFLSADKKTLDFQLVTNFSEDQIRVITAAAVPEPRDEGLMLFALLAFLTPKIRKYLAR